MNILKKHFDLVLILSIILISVIVMLTGNIDMLVKKKNIYYEKAKVVSIETENLQEDPVVPNIKIGSQDLKLEILSGKYKGGIYNAKNALSRIYNVEAKTGMTLIAGIYMDGDNVQNVAVYSYKRDVLIYALIGLFFLLIVIIGGFKGFKSIIALVFTGILVLFFMIPLLFKGASPITAAVVTAIITTVATLLLINGIHRKTYSAMLGTILGVIIAGLIAFSAGQIAHLSGLTMDDAETMLYIAEQSGFNIKGLMFAAILIASLGAIMDVGMSIASAIFEIHSINPKMKVKELFASGMNVGKDVIGTMSNTLILAFAGGSLNLIIMIMSAKMPYHQIINLDILGTELIQGISGSIGIVLTVPITAIVSAYLAKKPIK